MNYIDTYVNSGDAVLREYVRSPWTGLVPDQPLHLSKSADTPGFNPSTDPDDRLYLYAYAPCLNTDEETQERWAYLDSPNVLYAGVNDKIPIIEIVDPDTLAVTGSLSFGGFKGVISGNMTQLNVPEADKYYLTDASRFQGAELQNKVKEGSDLLANMPGAIFVNTAHIGKLFRIRNAWSYISVVAVGAFVKFFEGLIKDAREQPRQGAIARYSLDGARLRSEPSVPTETNSVMTRIEQNPANVGVYDMTATVTFAANSNTAVIDISDYFDGTNHKMEDDHKFDPNNWFEVSFTSIPEENEAVKQKLNIASATAGTVANEGTITLERESKWNETASTFHLRIVFLASRIEVAQNV